ncbi:hypothetical protein [Cupriavidus sp. UYPR2.512]|uniref:hypothetical protein n=1 Tax=Cupriavidus sp. UYPR2.512 TaxID=1080187 RepID=UPI00037D0096|nr:hypothetical protein [Cupriavidus sp. UYPR2.512]UIF89447.1 hypothetical protein KAF44_29710 [Cupriavidus necator]
MTGNLQVFGVVGTRHEAMFSAQLIPVQVFEAKLNQVLATTAISTLVARIESGASATQFDDDLWWTIVDDLKAYLGGQAANMAGDSRDEQDQALVTAESWVEDNISNASRSTIVGAAIVLYGYAKAETMIFELGAAVAA